MTDWSVIIQSQPKNPSSPKRICLPAMSSDSPSADPAQRFDARCLARLWIAGVMALVSVGCRTEAAKSPEVKPPEVFVAHPTQETITEQEIFTGRLMPMEMVEVRGRVNG